MGYYMTRRIGFLAASCVAALVLGGDLGLARAQSAPAELQPYVLGVSDVVSISVWKNPELGITTPVRPDGIVSVPLVGEIQAAGKAPSVIRAELAQRFSEYVTAPGVSVVVTEIHSRKVYVMGEVNQSGAFDLFQPMRLIQVLALAGGFTEFAKKDEVVILRGQTRLVVSIKAVSSGRRLEDNILLEPGDTVVVP